VTLVQVRKDSHHLKMLEQRGIKALVPEADDRQVINRVIFQELV